MINHKASLSLILFFVVQSSFGATIERQIGIFSIVKFPNDECTTESDTSISGLCVNAEECGERGGESDGQCASGFGVCCMFSVSECGDATVSQNVTYVQNPSYPSAYTTTGSTCKYTINAVASDPVVCQVRLDFQTFAISQPTATTGSCDKDKIFFTSPTGGGWSLPRLCGTLTDQHMYIETGGQSTAATFTITTSTSDTSTSRYWNIKISQIPCHTNYMAPHDCLQYHTGRSGTFRTFNNPTGTVVANTLYRICIRQELNTCGAIYSTHQISSSVDPFQFGTATTAKRDRSCGANGHILVRMDTDVADIYCGGIFNSDGATTAHGSVFTFITPPQVYVFTPGVTDLVQSATGASLQYFLTGCGSRVTQTTEN